jgi:uncharacterized cofD-like protein
MVRLPWGRLSASGSRALERRSGKRRQSLIHKARLLFSVIRTVHGQVACALTSGRVQAISLVPPNPPVSLEAVQAIQEADWVVFGPGSWFTSVLPHLKVPELAKALHSTNARRLVILNLAPQVGETDGFSPQKHLEVLRLHAPSLRIDAVLANTSVVEDPAELEKAASALGARLVLGDVRASDGSPRHDGPRLAALLDEIFHEEQYSIEAGRETDAGAGYRWCGSRTECYPEYSS